MLRAGISPHLFVIHGFPGETAQEAQQTIAYARQVVADAAARFDNPYTTWGGSPFVLDIHSPVGKHPERFGVQLVPPGPGHDLALARDYTVTTGLSRRQAEALANSGAGKATIRRNVWFRTSTESALAEVEEFTFLRAAARAPNAEPLRRPLAHVQYPSHTRLRLAATVLPLDWTADAEGRLGALALYHGDGDQFAQLSWAHGASNAVLRDGGTAAEFADWFSAHKVQWGGETGAGLVELLVRHGFLDSADVTRAPLTDLTGWRFAAEPGVLVTDEGEDRVLVHSPLTGNTVRLNPLGHLIWLCCADAHGSVKDISAELTGPQGQRRQVGRALRDLAELGMVFPVATLARQPDDMAADFAVAGG